MEKKLYLKPETEVVELEVAENILGVSDFDPSAPIIIEPSKPDPTNPPTPAF